MRCAMRSFVVVLRYPLVNDTLGFLDRSKQLVIQAAIAKDILQGLVLSVLLRPPTVSRACGYARLTSCGPACLTTDTSYY
jgi:hypothetical protein